MLVTRTPEPAVPVKWRQSGPWVGLAGMVVALWFYGFTGLVAPWWVVVLMLALWVLLLVIAVRNFARHPLVVLLMPFLAMAVWFAVVSAGGAWWGWS